MVENIKKNIEEKLHQYPYYVKNKPLSLDRIKQLLKKLGSPEKNLPPVIHVAGTNGKGSTIAFLREFFEASSLNVHSYTSPHLQCYSERILLSSQKISTSYLLELIEEIENINNQDRVEVSLFEFFTSLAFYAFSKHQADVLLLETGLGGRLDATNVLSHVTASIITPISLDHQEFLGSTIKEIAAEKAGIIKEHCPVFISQQTPEALDVLKKAATEKNASLYYAHEDWTYETTDDGFDHFISGQKTSFPKPSLEGSHQYVNASTAIACVKNLPEFSITDEAIKKGLSTTFWKGRLERITNTYLNKNFDPHQDWEIWIDGGHNPAAAKTLSQTFSKWQDKPLSVIIAMMKSKDASDFIKHIGPYIDNMITLPIQEEDCYPAQELASIANEHGVEAQPCETLHEAFEALKQCKQNKGRLFIGGSLYFIGKIFDICENKNE